jgi:phytoene desaturase
MLQIEKNLKMNTKREIKKALVVGTGLGGLCTAMRLASQGYQVTILERNGQAGGRLNQIKKDGFTFDTGPSFFSMSYEFEEFARDCSIELPFDFVELDPLYTVNFKGDAKTYHLYKDPQKLAAQFADVEPDFAEKMERYLNECSKAFHDTVDIVIKQNFESLWHYLKSLMQVNPVHLPKLYRSFWQQVKRHFKSPEARRIISLVAFFLGRTPFDTSAIYTLLSYTEFRHDGYYNVKGGMYKIVEGLVKSLDEAGVRIVYNTNIIGYQSEASQVKALVDDRGNVWGADVFVVNGDAALFRGEVMKRSGYSMKKLSKMSWTMGYLTVYVGLDCKLPQVNHHNYYLGSNFEAYAGNIMRQPDTLEKPYYYVNVLSKHNDDCAPEGCESLFFVCPVPNLKFKPDWSDKDTIVQSILNDFSERIGQEIQPNIKTLTVYTPEDWRDRFNLHYGAGLGLSHSMRQIGALRPGNVDEQFPNLFYVGASTIPGAGLPMSVISSKLVSERVLKLKEGTQTPAD